MTYSIIKFGASSAAGAVGGNRTHRYITDGTQNITRINRNDMIATTIGTATPLLAIKAFPENKMISSIISFVATAFSVAYGLTEALNNHDNNTVNLSLPNKKNDITSAKETVKNIFHETIEKSIFTDQERKKYGYRLNKDDIIVNTFIASEYILDTNIENPQYRRDLTRDKETFDILIEKKLYPFLGTSAEDIKQTEKIAKTQKDNLETILSSKEKAEQATRPFNISLKHLEENGLKEKGLSDYFNKKQVIHNVINDLNKIITAKNDPQLPLQEPTKKLAMVIKADIEKKHKSSLQSEVMKVIEHCSSNKFHKWDSIPYKQMRNDIDTLDANQLNQFLSFTYEQTKWKNDNIKDISFENDWFTHKDVFYVHNQDRTKTEISQAKYSNFDLDNYEKICEKFGKDAMSYTKLYGEHNALTRLKNVFNEALREKILSNSDSPFQLDYNRYTHAQNAYKELDEAIEAQDKKPSWFERMRKQLNTTIDTHFTSSEQTIEEEQKPSPSQILTITDTEVKAFGSKDKALEVRNQLMELKTGDTIEDFDKRKNKTFKKLSIQYHSDKTNGSDNAQAFINKINKYVDFDLAKKFWALPNDKREH